MTKEFAKDHLNLVLSFFPRVESQIALLAGLEIAMVGYLASHLPKVSAAWMRMGTWPAIALTATTATLLSSFVYLYRATFPNLDGGESSFVYFRAIANRTEAKFITTYAKLEDDELTQDLGGQIWRNSQILKDKYDRFKRACVFFALAIPAWVASVLLFS